MLEIIALFFLTGQIGRLALQKGLKPITWKIHTILLWVGGEMAGIIVGVSLFGQTNLTASLLTGYIFAIATYILLRYNLYSRPDQEEPGRSN
ncbi:MAG: hypothetical protein GC171_07540 [Terrimonas sp.]|nr:hypothetical protein [Terrimonas sp.]